MASEVEEFAISGERIHRLFERGREQIKLITDSVTVHCVCRLWTCSPEAMKTFHTPKTFSRSSLDQAALAHPNPPSARMESPLLRTRRGLRGAIAAGLLGGMFALGSAAAHASQAWGSINNFDTVNDTGQQCHGFEIDIEDCHSTAITYTFDYNHYGTSIITEDDSVPGHPKCIIQWKAKKNPNGTWAAYTAVPTAPIPPTMGHQFTNPAVNFGGEHFGVGYNVAVGAVSYNWLIDNGAGVLVKGGAVQVSTPSFTYYPPVVAAAPPQVQAVIAPPPPPAPPPKEFGDALWVKEIRTTAHNNHKVKLRDLVSEDPADPNGKNWKNGEPDEVEVEWQILQKDNAKPDGGPKNNVPAAAEALPNGDEVVTRGIPSRRRIVITRASFVVGVSPIQLEAGR